MARPPQGQVVEREFLTLALWDQLDRVTCEHVARAVERGLPEPWRFKGVQWHECGDQRRHLAEFDWNGTAFVLIPGREATLGWDRSDRGQFDPAQVEEADATLKGYSPTWSIWEYLDENLSVHRRVSIPPALAARRCRLADRHLTELRDWDAVRHRLPTADEWEFFFSASIWRPGDWFKHAADLPLDDVLTLSPFGLEHPGRCDPSRHVYEHCHGLAKVRGTDGGGNEASGFRGLLGTMPFSPSFSSPDWEREIVLVARSTVIRRVFSLPEWLLG